MPEAHYIVELVAQSHETDRTDLTNEDVITLPVVDGPYDSHKHAVSAMPSANHTGEGYATVTIAEDDPDYIDVEAA